MATTARQKAAARANLEKARRVRALQARRKKLGQASLRAMAAGDRAKGQRLNRRSAWYATRALKVKYGDVHPVTGTTSVRHGVRR
jgi:hypothetical protein